MKKLFNILLLVLVFTSVSVASTDASVEGALIDFVLIAIGSFYAVVIYFLYSYANKYRLTFLVSYIEKVVKRVEQETKASAERIIHKKFKELSTKNEKLAYALSIIEKDYAGFFNTIYGYLIGVYDDKVVTIIESKVYDIKEK